MTSKARYIFIASMDIAPEREALFNEVYDNEHVPLLSQVPGVLSVSRYVKEDFEMVIGEERVFRPTPEEPKYSAVYEIESPDVLVSEAWASAVDQGRWPTEVRPFTRNRRHVLRKLV